MQEQKRNYKTIAESEEREIKLNKKAGQRKRIKSNARNEQSRKEHKKKRRREHKQQTLEHTRADKTRNEHKRVGKKRT